MKKCSIMVIDDDKVDRYLLKRTISKLDIEVKIFEADTGKSALDFLANYEENSKLYGEDFPPLLIFLDINMPIMNGFEFLEAFSKLRAGSYDYSSSVFTMYTSSEREQDKKKVESYEFVKGFVIKGDMSPQVLQEIIDEYV